MEKFASPTPLSAAAPAPERRKPVLLADEVDTPAVSKPPPVAMTSPMAGLSAYRPTASVSTKILPGSPIAAPPLGRALHSESTLGYWLAVLAGAAVTFGLILFLAGLK